MCVRNTASIVWFFFWLGKNASIMSKRLTCDAQLASVATFSSSSVKVLRAFSDQTFSFERVVVADLVTSNCSFIIIFCTKRPLGALLVVQSLQWCIDNIFFYFQLNEEYIFWKM
jgi:hypothetical protein